MTSNNGRLLAELARTGDEDLLDDDDSDLTPRQRRLRKEFPPPDAAEILELKEWMQRRFQNYHDGVSSTLTDDSRASGAVGIRTMRYGNDETPKKLKDRMSNSIRVRTMLSHQEIESVRSMLSRNPLRIRIPSAGSTQTAKDKANLETRWANELAPALERRAVFPMMESQDDAQVEGLGGWEVFLTKAYEDVDFEQSPDESEDEYNDRIEEELRSTGLPFGVRPLDNLSVLFDTDEEGISQAIIIERKRYRPLYRRLRASMSAEEWAKARLPDPGHPSTSSGMGLSATTGDEVTTLRYYDRVNYAYVVEDKIVDQGRHGLPGVPIFPTFAHVTSSPELGNKLQGVTYGLAGLELVINDVLTQAADAELTYNRPRPVAIAAVGSPSPATDVLDLSGPGMPILPVGYSVADAFKDFRQTQGSPIATALLGFWRSNTLNQVATGQAPGADVSGFAMNLMTQSSIGPYNPLFQSKSVSWGRLLDFIRVMIRDSIGEDVYLSTDGKGDDADAVEWLKLGPDDISEVPAQVTLDPTSDAEKVAVANWLGTGVEKGWVPEEELLRRGYGSPDVEEWYDSIDLDTYRRELRKENVIQLIEEMRERRELVQQAQLVGPDGQTPINAGDQAAGGIPAEPQPATIGALNANNGRSGGMDETIEGFRPARQGLRGNAEVVGGVS